MIKMGKIIQNSYIWIPACAGMTGCMVVFMVFVVLDSRPHLRGDRLCEGMTGCMVVFMVFVVLDSRPHLRGDRLCVGMTAVEWLREGRLCEGMIKMGKIIQNSYI